MRCVVVIGYLTVGFGRPRCGIMICGNGAAAVGSIICSKNYRGAKMAENQSSSRGRRKFQNQSFMKTSPSGKLQLVCIPRRTERCLRSAVLQGTSRVTSGQGHSRPRSFLSHRFETAPIVSHGQRAVAGLGHAAIRDPELLMLDERWRHERAEREATA